MGLSHIHSTRVIGLKYFFFFISLQVLSTLDFVSQKYLYQPMQKVKTLQKNTKDMALPPTHLMIFLAMPASCHLVWSLNSWFPSPNSHTFSRSTSSYKIRNIFLYPPKLLIRLFCSLLDFLFPANMLWAMAIQHLLTVPTLSETLQLASVKRRSESDSIFIEQSTFFFPNKSISPTD